MGDGKLEKRFEDVARSDHAAVQSLPFSARAETILDRPECLLALSQLEIYAAEKRPCA